MFCVKRKNSLMPDFIRIKEFFKKLKEFLSKDEELFKKALALYGLMVDTDSLQIPFIQAMHSFVNLHLVVPSQTVKLGYIGQLAERTVRFGRIPTQFAILQHNLH